MLICNVVGARPNFMKIAPLVHELQRRTISQFLLHTGQHYDTNMSHVFFEELGLPKPDIYLGVGSDTHARQTARIMVEFEQVCQKERPDLVIVVGDVNSTLAVTLVAAKLGIPIAHVEAGLRSFDRSMPEELNRVVTDQLSELLFTTEEDANQHLRQEGIAEERIHFVGNCMIDTLVKHVDVAVKRGPWQSFSLEPNNYALLTLHRPSNVDDPKTLKLLLNVVNEIAERIPILFSVHPRTRNRMTQLGISLSPHLLLHEPLPYLSFLGLMAKARFVMTDSGGIQEETTALAIPCLTLRWNTERPITVKYGTNRLVGTDPEKIRQSAEAILTGKWSSGNRPPLWDGQAAPRIVDVIESWASSVAIQ